MMHNYTRLLLKALQQGIVDAGTVAHATIYHDEWCASHIKKECNCNPDVIVEAEGARFFIQEDGTLSLEEPK